MVTPCFLFYRLLYLNLRCFSLMVKHNATKIRLQKDEGVLKKAQGELGNS